MILTDYEPSKVGQENFSNNNEPRSYSTEIDNFIIMNMYGKYSTTKERKKKKGCD